jgi:uncharacterized membrane protein
VAGEDHRVHPTLDDPVATAASEAVGGPMGEHARPARHWWAPTLLVLLAACAFALGMLQKAPCYEDTWLDGEERYTAMCYSDLPFLYVGRGLAELTWPYDDDEAVRARYPEVMEYPVGISYFAWATAHAAVEASVRIDAWRAAVDGDPVPEPVDVRDRSTVPVDDLYDDHQVRQEMRAFVLLSALVFALVVMLSTWLLARTHRHRPWDAALFALSPALLLTGLVNWDLLAVGLVAGALWAWSRDRPVLTGVLVGLGTATKLYPLFLLGGLLVLCLRRRRWRDLALASLAAALAWLVANAPAYLSGPEQWRVFWTFNSERGADLGSIWLVLSQAGASVDAALVNDVSLAFFAGWCAMVLVLGLRAPEDPRLAQLGFLVVAGFLLVNKVYSPQYVLWLLPLAVLARPRWRDQLVWQAGEVFYFAAVWWYLNGDLAPGGGDDPAIYWIAIVVRIACQLYLVGVVVRDVVQPWHDPVRRSLG